MFVWAAEQMNCWDQPRSPSVCYNFWVGCISWWKREIIKKNLYSTVEISTQYLSKIDIFLNHCNSFFKIFAHDYCGRDPIWYLEMIIMGKKVNKGVHVHGTRKRSTNRVKPIHHSHNVWRCLLFALLLLPALIEEFGRFDAQEHVGLN